MTKERCLVLLGMLQILLRKAIPRLLLMQLYLVHFLLCSLFLASIAYLTSFGQNEHKGNNEVRRRSRFLRRRGRVRRLKYTWKSAAYHSIRKRITERKDQPCRQYNPCGCQSACGKQCPCLQNGTCCEKYCG